MRWLNFLNVILHTTWMTLRARSLPVMKASGRHCEALKSEEHLIYFMLVIY